MSPPASSNCHLTKIQLKAIIRDDDVTKLQEFLNKPVSRNIQQIISKTLSQAIVQQKRQCFDFLVNHKYTNLDARNGFKKMTHLHYAVEIGDPYYALALIRMGADVNLVDYYGSSPLHLTTNVLVAQELILKGVDVNHRGRDHNDTPIFNATFADEFNQDLFDCLLFYGGDVTIPDQYGNLPFFECPHPKIEEMLFKLTFDSLERYKVKLKDILQLIERESPFFYHLLELCSGINYDPYNCWDRRGNSLIYWKFWDWEVFDNDNKLMMMHSLLDKFHDITSKVMCDFNPLREKPYNLPKIVYTLDETYASNIMFNSFIQRPQDLYILLEKYHSIALIFYLLSKGVQVTSFEMDIIYKDQGFSELFEILLHMEIVPSEMSVDYRYVQHIYDPNYSVSNINTSENLRKMLFKFFYPIKGVPSLMELSREVARRHLVSSYGIKNSGMFLAILKCLPIPKILKDVLCYKQPIY